MEPIILNGYHTLIAATLVLLIGRFFVSKIKFLQDFNIPEAVAGGLVAAIVILCLYHWMGLSFQFEKSLQNAFMLAFFSSVGLSADFSRLKQGGMPLVIFLAVVGIFIIIQNASVSDLPQH
ncbi:putative sodium/glutamate symporter [Actinobacillus pleuropneumoniae]|nr:putative sodium/glutamate symporter [Actinobacillus pleuropneumoniae]KIE96675.1 putative sodium/glutamate symporter [Actinobacillus pleuropneumoniae]